MEYKITFSSETGYLSKTHIGGTVYISFITNRLLNKKEKTQLKKISDNIDHLLITNDKNIIKQSDRFILLKNMHDVLIDISDIMWYFINKLHISVQKTKIKINNEKLTTIGIINDDNIQKLNIV